MGARRRCCCVCWEFTDTFIRAESTDIGTWWNEATGDAEGDWEIILYDSKYVLHEKYGETPGAGGTSAAIVFCTQRVPVRTIVQDSESVTTDGEMFIYVDVKDPQEDDIYRIYPNCTDEETLGTLTVEFEYTDDVTHAWLITIGGDTLETTGEPSGEGLVRLSVCADHTMGQIKACVGELGVSPTLYVDSDPGSGQYAAIGHGNSATGAMFDQFVVGELRIPNEICYACFCTCDDFIMPYTIHGKFVYTSNGVNDRLACLSAVDEWEMTAVSGLSTMIWTGEVEVTTVEDPPVTQRIVFTLICDESWTLSITIYVGEVEDTTCECFKSTWYGDPKYVTARTEDEDPQPDYYSTCDPFSLMYGPWTVNVQDECSWCHETMDPLDCYFSIPPDPIDPEDPTICNGEFWIEITE